MAVQTLYVIAIDRRWGAVPYKKDRGSQPSVAGGSSSHYSIERRDAFELSNDLVTYRSKPDINGDWTMATERDRNLVEQAIGHQFHDQELLKKAMTAAGAEVDDHDGNRHLASVGQAVLRLVIADSGYTKVMLRGPPDHLLIIRMNLAKPVLGQMGEAQALLDSKSRLASAATQLGIVGCIKVCPISGPASKSVIALAMRAIIGAVWKDTSSLDSVGALVQRLRSVARTLSHHGTCAYASQSSRLRI